MNRDRLLLLPILLLLVSPCLSQDVNGSLQGRILDSMRVPIPGVDIIVSGSSLQGLRGTPTDNQGYFQMFSVPVGMYTIRINHIGYQGLRYDDVAVRLGRSTNLGEIVLETRAVELSETVVSGQRTLIDPSSTAVGTNLTPTTFTVLPLDRNFRSIATLAPQANASFLGDEVNIAGSTGLENIYFVDGINVTDPNQGLTSTNLPYNFVKEIQIKTGGYEAEYGRALGGIMNVITNSGGNDLEGQAFSFYTGDALRSTPRLGVSDTKLDKLSQYDVGFGIGGAIIRDHLWFYTAYNPTFDNRVLSFPGSGPQNDDRTLHLFAGKLTWQLSAASSFTLAVLGDPSEEDCVAPGSVFGFPGTVANSDVVLGKLTQGGTAFSLQARHLIGSDILLIASVSRLDRKDDNTPLTSLGSTQPCLNDYVTGVASGGYGSYTKCHSARTAVQASATIVVGLHTFKVGGEYEDTFLDMDLHYNIIYRYSETAYTWFEALTRGKVHNRTPTLYLQDSWQVSDRLRLNAGLRWDAQYFVRPNGAVAQSITDEFQPRVGFVYQPGELGSQKVFGSVGRFYEQVPVWPIENWYGHTSQAIVQYPQNPLLNSGHGDTLSAAQTTGVPNVPGLLGQHFDELSLGYENLLMQQFKFGVRGIYRTLRSAIEDGFSPSGTYGIGNPGRGALSYLPSATRDYTALELTVERSGEAKFTFFASYVLSRNYGNYTGLAATDLVPYGPNTGPQFDFVEQTVNGTGLLPNDKTHVFKFFGAYRFDFGLKAGMGFLWQSGMPLSEYGGIPAGSPYWSFVRQRGTAGRAPTNWDLNFRFTYDLPIFTATRTKPRLLLDVLHVGNPREAVTFDQVHYTAVDANGNQINPNGNYGMVTHYQPPMSMRLGLEVGF